MCQINMVCAGLTAALTSTCLEIPLMVAALLRKATSIYGGYVGTKLERTNVLINIFFTIVIRLPRRLTMIHPTAFCLALHLS